MKKVSVFAFLMAFLFLQAACLAGYPRVLLKTNFGDITMELYNDKAPVTVENFLQYVRTGFYDDLLFHRVIEGFMIQGGGFYVGDGYPYQQITNAPIINESYNNLSNLRGTVAMARTPDPNSATSEFFINLVDNLFLDKKNAADKIGYCVFGKVVSGMNVVDAIGQTPVEDLRYIDPAFQNIPYPTLVIINNAELLTPGYWIPADIGNDGIANFRDFAYLAANWKKTGNNLWGDLNSNNAVDANDVNLFHQGWLTKTAWYKPIEQDLNNDGVVNFRDFAILSDNWGWPGRRLAGNFNQDLYVDEYDLMFFAEKWLAP